MWIVKKASIVRLALGLLGVSVAFADSAKPEAKEKKLPAAVDLRPKFEKWGLERRDQGARGTCSVFTMAGALEFALAKQKNQGERLSVEYLNWASNKAVGRDQD